MRLISYFVVYVLGVMTPFIILAFCMCVYKFRDLTE